ncbi:MAG: hypothetical protein EP332_02980 [Bacteroidetes bacterium]|nr:MAG: hypothetical protein EP332_02980 [Bacteroidota bacterium]
MKKLYFLLGVSVLLASCASQKYSRTDNITDDVYFSPDDIPESIQYTSVKPEDTTNNGFTYDNTNSTANPNAAYRSYQPDPGTTPSNTVTQNTPNYGTTNQSTNYFSQNFFMNTGFGFNPYYGNFGMLGYQPYHRFPHQRYGWSFTWGNPYWNLGYNNYPSAWYYSPWNSYYQPYYSPFYDPFYNPFYNPYYYSNPYYYNSWYSGYGYPYYYNYPNYFNPGIGGGSSTITNNGIRRRSPGTIVPNNTGGYKPGGRAPSTVTPSNPVIPSAPGRDIGTPGTSPQKGGSGISPSNGSNDRRGSGSSGSTNDPNNGRQPSVQPQSRPSTPQTRPSAPQQEPQAPRTRPSSPSTPKPQPAPPSRQPSYQPQPSPKPAPSRQPSYNPPSRPSGGGSSGGGSSPRRRR